MKQLLNVSSVFSHKELNTKLVLAGSRYLLELKKLVILGFSCF